MNRCTYMKKITAFYGGFGFIPKKEQCTKPEYKDGLCKQHYDKKVIKTTPWGQREEYRDVTEQEFLSGKPVLLKTSLSHIKYSFHRKGMCRWSELQKRWFSEFKLFADYTLYCVKK